MAACTKFTCAHCGFHVDAWSDGNRYLTDHQGKRHYFYHPGDLTAMRAFAEAQTGGVMTEADYLAFLQARCGNEGDWLCLKCGCETRRDPKRDPMKCPDCGQQKRRDTNKLEGRRCPKCAQGTFHGEITAIS